MLNRKTTTLLCAAVLGLTLCGVSALAADPDSPEPAEAQAEEILPGPDTNEQPLEDSPVLSDPAPAPEEEPEEEEPFLPEATAPDPVGSVSFANLNSRLRENNFNMLALAETIAAIEAIDYEKMTDDMRRSLNQIANAQWMLLLAGQNDSYSAASLQSTYDSLRNTFEDLKDGVIQDDNAAVIRQLRNAQDQTVMAAESLYIALVEMTQSGSALDRQLTALDRTIQELALRYDLGQISSLTLQQTRAGRAALVSGRQTLSMNITNYKTQLELLIGAEQSGNIQLQPLPQVGKKQLDAMDQEADLASAKENSYELFAAQRTLKDARKDYIDSGATDDMTDTRYKIVSARHTWKAAQHTYDATVQSFENRFLTLYNQVKDYQQVLDAAKTSLAFEKASYASMQLKYDQGSLAENKLLDAADKVSEAQEKVDAAGIDLFSAYNNYRWAVDYGILN